MAGFLAMANEFPLKTALGICSKLDVKFLYFTGFSYEHSILWRELLNWNRIVKVTDIILEMHLNLQKYLVIFRHRKILHIGKFERKHKILLD